MKRRTIFATILLSLLGASALVPEASASATLKRVQTHPDGQIELTFDVPIDPAQIKTEYFRDIVQVSLSGVNVYPAKIVGADTEHVTKVFAYQYAPKLVRARFTMRNGNAESYQSAVEMKPAGTALLLRFSAPKAAIAPPVVAEPPKAAAEPIVAKAPEKTEKSEKRPLTGNLTGKGQPLAAGNSPAAPAKLKWMFALVVLFGGALLTLRFVISRRKGKRRSEAGEGRFVAWTKRVLGAKLGGSPDLIQVVSTHPIGPKKNILVVRVREKTLVLAVADDSISLLSELDGDEVYEDGAVPERAGFDFSAFLKDARRPGAAAPRQAAPAPRQAPSVPVPSSARASERAEAPLESPVDAALRSAQPAARAEISATRQNIRQRLQGLKEL